MDRLKASVRRALLSIAGVVESPGVFTDEDAFWMNGSQIACWKLDGKLEVRLTKVAIREQRERLKADPRISFHSKSSDWIDITLASATDVPFAADLARIAADAHRPANGTTPKPPPTGADLERRRRFH